MPAERGHPDNRARHVGICGVLWGTSWGAGAAAWDLESPRARTRPAREGHWQPPALLHPFNATDSNPQPPLGLGCL